MFCPECRAEYREGFTHCADCGVPLVAALLESEAAKFVDENLARLWTGSDASFYSALTAALQSAGIPFFDNPPQDHYNWLAARGHGGALTAGVPNFDIHVPESHFAAAEEILRSLLNQATTELTE